MSAKKLWLATRNEVPCLAAHFGDCRWEPGAAGYVYGGECWIEKQPDGSFYTMVDRFDISSNNLEEVEDFLWTGWADAEWIPETEGSNG